MGRFDVIFLNDARSFLESLEVKAARKVLLSIELAQKSIAPTSFKKLTHEIWEFRAESGGIQFRMLAFWHRKSPEKPRVVVTHGFKKKTTKTPKSEISRAIRIRARYFHNL